MKNIEILMIGIISIFLIVVGWVFMRVGKIVYGTDAVLIWSMGMAFWLGMTTFVHLIIGVIQDNKQKGTKE